MKTKTKIMISVDAGALQKFDNMLKTRMIPRSRLIDQMMKNELENWENKR